MPGELDTCTFQKQLGREFHRRDHAVSFVAPDERDVDLVLGGAAHKMQSLDGGWFEIAGSEGGGALLLPPCDGTESPIPPPRHRSGSFR